MYDKMNKDVDGPIITNVVKIFSSLFLTILLGIIYNIFMIKKSTQVKHYYHILGGLFICYWNFGIDTRHSLLTCFTIWLSIKALGPTVQMVALNFIFSMAYLMYGYYEKFSLNIQNYTWTMPQCVLTLSMIALSFDIYDGEQNNQNLLISNKLNAGDSQRKISINEDTALTNIPTFIEILSKTYFPPTFLIGPQFKFKDYLQFIDSQENLLHFCWKQSILRLFLGVIYAILYLIGDIYWPQSYLWSQEFKTHSLLIKLTIITLVQKLFSSKYICGWLVSESACIIYGISRDPNSNLDDRCCNISLLHYETTATFRGVIESFNTSTNEFASKYIYKRLKFLRSKMLSQISTLLFLAVWHGLAFAYYNTFALELVVMKMENDIAKKVIAYRTQNQRFNQLLNTTSIRWIIYVIMRLHVLYGLSYCFTSFAILDTKRWMIVLNEVYFIGHWIYGSWFIISIFLESISKNVSQEPFEKKS